MCSISVCLVHNLRKYRLGMGFLLLRRGGSLQCLFFGGDFWTLEKSGEEVRVTGH